MSYRDYYNYTIEDFILDEKFVRWARDPNDESADFWKQFLVLYPEKYEIVHRSQQIVMAASVRPECLTAAEVRKEVERFLDNTLYSEDIPHVERQPNLFIRRIVNGSNLIKFTAAAFILIAFGTSYFFKEKISAFEIPAISTKKQSENLIETSNNTKSSMNIVLPDGTRVVLSPGSVLKYPIQFQNERKVLLEGEANFSVTHQNEPFLVIAGDMVTKVLGTRFTVRAFDAEIRNSVKVQSGKVSVYTMAPEKASNSAKMVEGLILTANQEGLFEKEKLHFSKTLVENPEPLNIEERYQETEYSEVPLSEILEQISGQFGISIQHDKNSLKHCRITAVFSGETLYEQLDILCKIASVSYQIVDGQIVISGEGCH